MRGYLYGGVCAVAIAAAAMPAAAQEVTSTIRGQVMSAGAPVAGAEVVVTHVPSGTTSTTMSNAEGNFSAAGLRVGGPFSVRVSAPGYATTVVTDISLVAGQPFTVPIELTAEGQDIVVTARALPGVADTAGGPATVLDRQAIEGVATVQRDLRDIVRRDPFATIDAGRSTRGVLIAGQNARLNKFSVDGVRFSDNFGLNDGGLPTARGPVPIDAIEQLSVKVAPYDIREGDFQGGAINVVLRSGTNDLTGSAFYTYSSDDLTGRRTRVGPGTPTGRIALDFKSRNYGAFLSGPIIRDKLFFTLAYEYLKEDTPIQIGTAGFPTVVPNLTTAQIDTVSGIANSVYNYDTLGVQNTLLETDKKYVAKLDWNVTDGQRLSTTYIRNDSAQTSTSGFSSAVAASPVLTLGSNNYRRPEKVDSIVVQLNSDWSSRFHTELRGNYRAYDLTPVPFGAIPFAQMQVCLDAASTGSTVACTQGSTAAPGTARLYFGPDQFRHFNYVRTEQYGGEAVVRWEAGDFTMKLDAAWQHLDVANAFTQNAYGNYYFDSVADLQNRRASQLTLGGSITGNLEDTLASFSYDQYTFGGQVAWDPLTTLNVTAGARIDLYGGTTPPPLNSFFLDRYGFSNRATSNGRSVFQPRLSFRYAPTDTVQVRGGFGLFAGGAPNVFLGNSYSVSGVFANSVTFERLATGGCRAPVPADVCAAALDNVNGRTFSSLVTDFLRTNTTSLALANVNALDPDYKLDSTWKSSLSVDWTPKFDNFLRGGWTLGGDVYYGRVNNASIYRDLRLAVTGTMPDGRPRYSSLTAGANTDLLLTNTDRGYSLVAVARVDKDFDFGLSLGASYTYQDVKDVSSMNGTTASGTYGQNAMVDPNIAAYGTSIYEVRDSIKFHIDFDHAFFGEYNTRISLFGEHRSGLPYSLTMNDPALVNGHSIFGTAGSANRYLLYVPNVSAIGADARVSYDSQATYDAFAAYVRANGLEQGAIVSKNSKRAPTWTKIDLHVDQEVPLPLGARFKLFADMENVLNFIDRDWGSLRQVAFPYLAPVVNVACAQTTSAGCAQYRYSNFSNPAINNVGRVSLWSLRIGAKVEF